MTLPERENDLALLLPNNSLVPLIKKIMKDITVDKSKSKENDASAT